MTTSFSGTARARTTRSSATTSRHQSVRRHPRVSRKWRTWRPAKPRRPTPHGSRAPRRGSGLERLRADLHEPAELLSAEYVRNDSVGLETTRGARPAHVVLQDRGKLGRSVEMAQQARTRS